MTRTYGLFCYKFIEAMNGDIYRIQFHRENYTGEAFEIEKMGVTPFTINIDGQGEALTRPIVKSSLSIQIIDTEQFDYSIFYTASAFEWKVDVARTNEGQRFVWGGYLTPDSFQQACVKGATISLTARDNLGYLDEVDFDKVSYNYSDDHGDKIASVEDVIRSAIDFIGLDYLMRVEFKVQTAGEIGGSYTDLLSLCVNTRLFEGKTWGEALRMVLSSFGWQIRPSFVKRHLPSGAIGSVPMFYEVIDVAKLGNPESWNGTIEPLFLMNSKQMSIQPNWRELKIEQDYGVIENFFPMPTEEDYSVESNPPTIFKSYRRRYRKAKVPDMSTVDYLYYDPQLWARTISQTFKDEAAIGQNLVCLNGKRYAGGSLTNSIILSNITKQSDADPSLEYQFIRGDVMEGETIEVRLSVRKQLYALRNKNVTQGTTSSTATLDADLVIIPRAEIAGYLHDLSCTIACDIIINGWDTDYVCTSNGWRPIEELNGQPQIQFTFNSEGAYPYSSTYMEGGYFQEYYDILYAKDAANYNVENFTITANNTPRGTLRIKFYKPTFTQTSESYWDSDIVAVIFDNIKAQFNPDTRPSGQTLVIANDAAANIKETMTTSIGTCPANSGGALTFAGGVYSRTQWRTLVRGFRRDENDANPSALSVLTAKALMHHRRKTRNVYTGTIRYTLPYFESLLTIDGKTCAINAASYDILRNRMSGEYIEVEPYTDPAIELNDRVVSSGGSTIGGGTTSTTTTIIKVGGQAVETQRIYELKSVSATDALSQYVVVDNTGQSTAKKVRLNDVLAAATSHNKGYYATLADLISSFPSAPIGSIAYVGEKYPFTLFRYENNQWINTGQTGGDEHIDLSGYVRVDQMADTLYVEATEEEIEQMIANGTYDPTKVYYTTAEDNEQYVSADQIAALLFVETTEAEINKMIANGTYDPTKVYYTVED